MSIPQYEVYRLARDCGLLDKVDCSDDYFVPASADLLEIEAFALCVEQWLRKKAECDIMLRAMVGADNVKSWWQIPNRAFGVKKPFDCNLDKVYDYLLGYLQK